MTLNRSTRAIAVLASAGMLVGAFAAGPAEAGKKKKKKPATCAAFTPGLEEAAEAPVTQVTAAATEEKPVVIELEHPASTPVTAENLYFNVQVNNPASGLYILHEFGSDSDIDLYLYDAGGEEVASSGAFNPAPIPGVTDADGNGGMGFESIPGFAAGQCEGFTIESHPYLTPGTPATLKLWLGAAQ